MDQLEKAHKAGVVLGLAGFGTGQRLDIDVMLTEQPDTFNLYLIALMELQGMKNLPWPTPGGYSFQDGTQVDLKMSWFQLTGKYPASSRARPVRLTSSRHSWTTRD